MPKLTLPNDISANFDLQSQYSFTVEGIPQDVLDWFCDKSGYQESINGVPNPEEKIAFMKRMVILNIMDIAFSGNIVELRDQFRTSSTLF